MALVTGQDWINLTRSKLLGGFGEELNALASAYTAGGTAITLTYPMGNIAQGSYLSVGLNIFYVWSVTGQTATVIGGQNGSTDINLSSGTLVRVNPKFTDWDIWTELANDLADLSSPTNGIFGIDSTDFTYNAATTGYDLGTTAAANLMSMYEVKTLTPGPEKDMPRIPSYAYVVGRKSVVGDIPSGLALQFVRPELVTPGYTFRAVWKSVLVMPANTSAALSTSLLQPSAYDLPCLGAAIALMAGREIKRNFIEGQGDVRRATEVPPGAVAASANGLRQLRKSRVDSEAARLLQMFPPYKD